MIPRITGIWLACLSVSGAVTVGNDAQLRNALAELKPGSVVRIAPGNYRPGLSVRDIRGSADKPVLVEALDPENPPVFEGGNEAWHLTDVSHFTLRGLVCRKQKNNGINIDDGGSIDTPSEHVTLDQLHIEDTGPDGNFDAIKCSGVEHLKITACRISGWGGQAIDFVGCHHAEISGCGIIGKSGFSQHTGPQFKGGCSEVWMHHCRLTNAGQRPIQIGGSTGLDYFRPKDAPYEARAIRVEDNLIVGGDCAIAFTGADLSSFSHNTIIRPEKWIMRILQESREPRVIRCGDNTFSNNLIVFERAKVTTIANIGPETRAESFTFSGNHWFAADAPGQSRPDLPAEETGAVHGVDPDLGGPDHTPRKKLTAGVRSKPTSPPRR